MDVVIIFNGICSHTGIFRLWTGRCCKTNLLSQMIGLFAIRKVVRKCRPTQYMLDTGLFNLYTNKSGWVHIKQVIWKQPRNQKPTKYKTKIHNIQTDFVMIYVFLKMERRYTLHITVAT